MQTVGYNRCIIQGLDKDLKPVTAKKWTIEGEMNQGAGTSFDITGLSKEVVKIYGNNIPYFTLRKGIGNVVANLGFLDLPMECEQYILGFNKSTNGVIHIGDETEPPYCSVLFESRDLEGNVIGFGMYVGSFTRDGYKAETLNDDDFTPEPGEYVYTPITKKFEDGNHVVGIADSEETYKELEKECFGEVAAGRQMASNFNADVTNEEVLESDASEISQDAQLLSDDLVNTENKVNDDITETTDTIVNNETELSADENK